MKTVAGKTIAYITGVICIGLLLIEQGFVISVLWGWFATPFGAPVVGVAVAVGLAAISRAIRGPRSKISDSSFQTMAVQAIQPLLCLLIGFIAKQFV